ncbi:MAG: NAD(P)/FAD-dependent oxidoreductase [Burkholderiaceae bacterium]
MRTEFDAIIIGAGPAGSTAAIRLAQAGWSVALIEKQRFPRRKVCGECLAAGNLTLLDALGVGAAFHALAGPELKQVALLHGGDSIAADLPACDGQPHAWGRALGREQLDVLLLQRAIALGAHVLQPWAVQRVDGQAGAYQCLAQERETKTAVTLLAPLVMAAHGSWEPGLASSQAGTAHPKKPRPGDLFAFKANFTQSAVDEGVLPLLAFRGGYGGMVLGERGTLTLACCIRRDQLSVCRRQARGQNAGEAVQAYLAGQCRGVQEALHGATRQGAWLSVGPLRPGIRMPRDGGWLFLIGNAAGEAHPIIGEGMSMAMQAAWLLCDRMLAEPRILRDASVHRRVLKSYAQEWHARFARRLHLAALFAHVAMRPALAHLALPLLRTWPEIMTQAARWSDKAARPGFLPQKVPNQVSGASLQDGRFHEFRNGENA